MRVYADKHEVPRVLNGLGISIISTSKGILTDRQARKENVSKKEILKRLSFIDGVYVPSLREVKKGEFEQWIPKEEAKGSYEKTNGVRRLFIPKMNPADYPTKNLIANMPLVHNRFSVEVMRGCAQGCRFCQAGIWYRPCRELDADDVLDIAKKGICETGERELGLLSLSTADYKPVEALTDSIIDDPFFDKVDVSLPSIRVNSFGQTLAGKVAALKGGRSATFAPETGSERIRKMINKTITATAIRPGINPAPNVPVVIIVPI